MIKIALKKKNNNFNIFLNTFKKIPKLLGTINKKTQTIRLNLNLFTYYIADGFTLTNKLHKLILISSNYFINIKKKYVQIKY